MCELRSSPTCVSSPAPRRRGAASFRHFPGVELLGIRAPVLREIARAHRRDHALALELWASGMHEARIIAALVDEPKAVRRSQMERWVRDCDNWAVTDACCCVLFDRTPFAIEKAHAWSGRKPSLSSGPASSHAGLAVHRKELPDEVFLEFFPLIGARPSTSAISSRRRSTGRCARSANATRACVAPRSPKRKKFVGSIPVRPAGSPRTRSANSDAQNPNSNSQNPKDSTRRHPVESLPSRWRALRQPSLKLRMARRQRRLAFGQVRRQMLQLQMHIPWR